MPFLLEVLAFHMYWVPLLMSTWQYSCMEGGSVPNADVAAVNHFIWVTG